MTNQDLFASGNTALRTGLKKLARTLIQDVYLQNVENKWDNYRAGESPEVEVQVTNGGRNTVSGTAEVRIYEDSTGTLVKKPEPVLSGGAGRPADPDGELGESHLRR